MEPLVASSWDTGRPFCPVHAAQLTLAPFKMRQGRGQVCMASPHNRSHQSSQGRLSKRRCVTFFSSARCDLERVITPRWGWPVWARQGGRSLPRLLLVCSPGRVVADPHGLFLFSPRGGLRLHPAGLIKDWDEWALMTRQVPSFFLSCSRSSLGHAALYANHASQSRSERGTLAHPAYPGPRPRFDLRDASLHSSSVAHG